MEMGTIIFLIYILGMVLALWFNYILCGAKSDLERMNEDEEH